MDKLLKNLANKAGIRDEPSVLVYDPANPSTAQRSRAVPVSELSSLGGEIGGESVTGYGNVVNLEEPVLNFRYLDTNGDGTGIKQAIGDYSGAETSFFFTPLPGNVVNLSRMIIYIRDTGSFDSGGYGNGAVLTNGLKIQSTINGEVTEYTDGIFIKTNTDWARMCYDVSVSTFGSGDEALAARWTFTTTGAYMTLNADRGDKFEVIMNDDLSHLVEHTFLIQGHAIL